MAENERVNPFSNSARALFEQGVGMGWGDEGEAWLRSKLADEDYDVALKDINKKYSKYREEHPVISTGLEFAGSAVPASLAMLAGPETGGAAPVGVIKTLYNSPYARNAIITGPMTGAVQGAGMSSPGDRGLGMAEGAVIGGVTGAATPLVARGGLGALNWLRDRIAPSEALIKERALGKVSEAMSEDNLIPRDINRTVMYDYNRGIPSTIANASPSLASLADTVAQRSGPSGRLVDRVLGEQKAGARERVYQRSRNEISSGNYYEDAQRLADDLSAKAKPLYDEAYEHGIVNDPVINELLNSPRFKSAFREGKQIAKDRQTVAVARGEDPREYQLVDVYDSDPITGSPIRTLPDVRTLDYIKKGIDSKINTLFKAGKNTDALNLKDMRNELLNRLDDIVPAYKKARSEYAGDKEVINAMEAGYKNFPHLDHEEVQNMLGKMSTAEKEAFKTGVVRHIHSVVMDPSTDMNAAARVIESPETQKSLKELFDSPAHFDLYKAALLRESQLFKQANQIMGGSQTGRRVQARERFEQGPALDAAITDAVSGVGPWTSLQNLASRVASRAVMPDKVAHKVAELLMSKDPHEVAAAVKALENYDARAKTGAHISEHVEGGLTMGLSGAQQTRPENDQDKEINYDISKHERMLEGPNIEDYKPRNIPGSKMGTTE